ncbi:glucose transporter type 1-like isoform X1 [Stegodyphus dumicola]|uniref:glucose transporter type 1-like isoform X1 n=1 Tax=Stegodyphus dumicola TaxID=202533 RepID=UPI0015AFDA92|nr:glucose transporter type 1-like isoform X1 [Stegodyphus dumicola]XP_035230758.1 glucose transporter type 1-like isoform X1 [Stegodyphus dumicola]XP_035230759.1 glucose transporter type 1-like isoform X1 [Stegodyphus dumicola]
MKLYLVGITWDDRKLLPAETIFHGEDVELVDRLSTPELELLPVPTRMSCCAEGLTCMLVFAIFAAVLGMFQFGYNTGVINAPQKIIQKFIADVYKARTGKDISEDFRDLLWSLIVSVFAIGGMIGGMIGGSIADKFGRKGGLLVNNAFGIIGAALMGSSKISQSIEILVVGRLIIGMNCGVNTALVPMYLSEISPLTLRGGLGTVNQLGITIGLLLSQVLGIQAILGTERGWPFLFGISVIPAVLQLLILPLCPESPRYLLISKQQESLAREALQKLRCSSLVEEDIEEMKAEDRSQQHEPETAFTEEFRIQPPPVQITMWKLLQNRSLHLPLVIGVVMQLTQQLSGINAVLYYSTGLFMEAGLPENAAKYATIGVGSVMVVMTLVSIPLMDQKGRRTLQLYGLGGMFIFSIFITITMLVKFLYYWIAYLSVVSTLFFVVFYAIGPGPIPWMITAELFSQGPRPAAMSIAVTVNWFANFVVGLVFPQMQRVFEHYTFLAFTLFLAGFWTFTYKKIPETKNKTFEEISALFRRDDDPLNVNGMAVLRNSLQPTELIFEEKPVDQCEFHHRHHCRLRNMPGGPKEFAEVTPNHVEDAL